MSHLAKFAVTPGFEEGGSLFTPKQLSLLGSIVGNQAKIELTTFKQLYVEMEEERMDEVQQRLKEVGLEIYPAGFYTKSLITCNFCRGAEDTNMELAKQLNEAIAGIEVPYPLRIGYSGCALGTGEPLLKDIGIVKMKDVFDIYIGGEPKTIKPTLGQLAISGVTAEQLIRCVTRMIDFFQADGKKKEKYAKFIQRVSIEKIIEEAVRTESEAESS